MVEKNWPIERVLQEDDKLREAVGDDRPPYTYPLAQWCCLQELEKLHCAFAEGHKAALMKAIRECAVHELPLPPWITEQIKGPDYMMKTWDEMFGPMHPKGTKVKTLKARRITRFKVWSKIRTILADEHPAIDDALFERVAKELRIGQRQTKEYWYSFSEFMREIPPESPK